MKLGVDFDGTIIRYAVCAKQIGGDGHTITTTETLDGAKHELQLIINRAKKKKYMLRKVHLTAAVRASKRRLQARTAPAWMDTRL